MRNTKSSQLRKRTTEGSRRTPHTMGGATETHSPQIVLSPTAVYKTVSTPTKTQSPKANHRRRFSDLSPIVGVSNFSHQ